MDTMHPQAATPALVTNDAIRVLQSSRAPFTEATAAVISPSAGGVHAIGDKTVQLRLPVSTDAAAAFEAAAFGNLKAGGSPFLCPKDCKGSDLTLCVVGDALHYTLAIVSDPGNKQSNLGAEIRLTEPPRMCVAAATPAGSARLCELVLTLIVERPSTAGHPATRNRAEQCHTISIRRYDVADGRGGALMLGAEHAVGVQVTKPRSRKRSLRPTAARGGDGSGGASVDSVTSAISLVGGGGGGAEDSDELERGRKRCRQLEHENAALMAQVAKLQAQAEEHAEEQDIATLLRGLDDDLQGGDPGIYDSDATVRYGDDDEDDADLLLALDSMLA